VCIVSYSDNKMLKIKVWSKYIVMQCFHYELFVVTALMSVCYGYSSAS